MPALTRILLVEDSRSDARLLEATLQDAGVHRFQLTHVERLDEALAALGEGGIDIVLLDLHLPDSQGLETLAELKREQPGVPVVVSPASTTRTWRCAPCRRAPRTTSQRAWSTARCSPA